MRERGPPVAAKGMRHPRVRGATIVLHDDDAATRPDQPHQALQHALGVPDEMEGVCHEDTVEQRRITWQRNARGEVGFDGNDTFAQ